MPPPSSAHPGGERLCSWLQHWGAGNKPGKGCQSSWPLHSAWLLLLSSQELITQELSQPYVPFGLLI